MQNDHQVIQNKQNEIQNKHIETQIPQMTTNRCKMTTMRPKMTTEGRKTTTETESVLQGRWTFYSLSMAVADSLTEFHLTMLKVAYFFYHTK